MPILETVDLQPSSASWAHKMERVAMFLIFEITLDLQ